MTYVWVLAFILIGSGWLEFGLRTRVLSRWRRLVVALTIAVVPFIAWDLVAIAGRHWWFDEAQLAGITLPGELPLEELMFFPVVGLAAILTLEAVRSVRRGPGESLPEDAR